MRRVILGAVMAMAIDGYAQAALIGSPVIDRGNVDAATEITFINVSQTVQADDLIGFRYNQVQFIKFDFNTPDTTIWTTWPNTGTDVVPGGVIPFGAIAPSSSGEHRAYSFAANVVEQVQVPEPASLLLLGVGVIGGGRRLRRLRG